MSHRPGLRTLPLGSSAHPSREQAARGQLSPKQSLSPSGAVRAGPDRTGSARRAGVGGKRCWTRNWRQLLGYSDWGAGGALNRTARLTSGGEPGGRAGTHVWVGLEAGSGRGGREAPAARAS